MSVSVSYRHLTNPHVIPSLTLLGKFLPLAQRKQLGLNFAPIQDFVKACEREKAELMFVYGKRAPDNWPNAGQVVLDPLLFEKAEWEECLAAFDKLERKAFELAWDERVPVRVPADVAKLLTPDQLQAVDPFLDVQE